MALPNTDPQSFGFGFDFEEEVAPADRALQRAALLLLVIAWIVVAVFAWSRPLRAHDLSPRTVGLQLRINHAPADRLQALHGLGPALAQAIVTHRETHGPFATLADLENVPGIGPLTRQRLTPWVVPG